jgi:cyclomaltodextrinase
MTELGDTPAWVRDAVFYQIFPDRFARSERLVPPGPFEDWDAPPTHHGFKGGDLYGIVERLDYLAELGITALYLTPVFASASNHRYHTYDYYHVDPLLGGDAALRELLDACHARGMRIVLDGVFNHSGRGFWPFHHLAENGAASPYADWFFVDHAELSAGESLRPYPSEAERAELDESASAAEHMRGDASLHHLGYRAWWDLPALPKLNTDNPQLREHLLGAAEHWLRFGIDGWRLDVAEEIDAGFWQEFRARVRAVNPDAYIVAEIWRVKPEWLAGDTFDALMNYPLTEALLGFVAGERIDREVLETQHEYREFVAPSDAAAFAGQLEELLGAYRPEATAVQLNLLGSHDTPRFVTVAGGDPAAYRLALLAVMTLPGAPCIYYGDEIGMEGGHDPDCRRAFNWREEEWDGALLGLARDAIALRHAQPVLRHGDYRTLAADGMAVAYGRFGGGGGGAAAVIMLNAADEPSRLALAAPELAGRALRAVTLAGMPAPAIERASLAGGELELELAGRSGAVLLAD